LTREFDWGFKEGEVVGVVGKVCEFSLLEMKIELGISNVKTLTELARTFDVQRKVVSLTGAQTFTNSFRTI
jgi:hypothetical protein